MGLVHAYNTETGLLTQVPERYIGHPVLGKNYVLAEKDGKSFVPELYKSKTADEFIEAHPPRPKEKDEDEDSGDEDGDED